MYSSLSKKLPAMTTQLQSHNGTKGRCLALYPGAFRPPHRAHFTAVLDLLSRPSIDEVIVIISNRARSIPGTTLALDATVAKRIWSIYLQDIEKVRVAIAPHTAVAHALEYFDRLDVGDMLVFCMGEADIGKGDDRFRNLEALATQSGIQAQIIQAPTGSITTRSTSLRATLTQGATGREEFMTALPTHLTHTQREEVWNVCRKGMREMDDLIKDKIHAFIDRAQLGEIEDLGSTIQGKMDQVFRVRFKDGRCLFVKYAGDAVGTEKLGQKDSLKPRGRLSAERKALKWLRKNMQCNIEIPEAVHFEKKTWTLALTEVCPGGKLLQDDLKSGVFDPIIATKASQFLAECHTMTKHVPPLWGETETDRQHWKRMLAMRTIDLRLEDFPNELSHDLEALRLASEKAEENKFVHLNFHPKNILVSQETIGVIDFELSSSVGDPAYDLGSFLGQYVYWILASSSGNSWQEAIQNAAHAYQQVVGDLWQRMDSRVVAFTGSTLLSILEKENFTCNRDLADTVMQAGALLLAQGLEQHENPNQILCKTIYHFSG